MLATVKVTGKGFCNDLPDRVVEEAVATALKVHNKKLSKTMLGPVIFIDNPPRTGKLIGLSCPGCRALPNHDALTSVMQVGCVSCHRLAHVDDDLAIGGRVCDECQGALTSHNARCVRSVCAVCGLEHLYSPGDVEVDVRALAARAGATVADVEQAIAEGFLVPVN